MRERGAIRVGELHGLTAELARGSARAELLWNGGSTARVSLLALRVERRRRSGAWERGEGERARGMGFWGSCNARARARIEAGALPWASHGGDEVAAGGRLWAAWHGRGGSSAKQEAVERVGSDAWVPARSRGGRLALHGERVALHSGGEKQRKGAGGMGKGLVCNF